MSAKLKEKLAALRETFRASLPERLDAASQSLTRLSAAGSYDGAEAERLHRNLHELSGTAGFLGDAEISGRLRDALSICESAAYSSRAYTDRETVEIADTITETRRLAEIRVA